MKTALIGALLMLTVAACGAYHFPGGDHSGTGTVSGKVQVVGCGVVPAGTGICAPSRPASNLEIDFNGDGTVQSAVTDSAGEYSIKLPAATYKVTVKAPLIIVSGPEPLTVDSGANVVANYSVDSGIRAPVPQQ